MFSLLAPVLFKMYINDIAVNLISLSRLFADDTSFSYSNRDELQIKTLIDHDLQELDECSLPHNYRILHKHIQRLV
jgi:hypothetical protein